VKQILMASDLSARSDRALQRALALARRRGASLEVMHVVDDSLPPAIREQQASDARALIAQLLGAIPGSAEVRTTIEIARGSAHDAILERAASINADLIVLGITRYSVYELFHGTTAERVVRLSRFPVLLVKEPAIEGYSRVLIASDGSPAALRAMATAIAVAPDAEFFLLHAIHVPFKGLLGPEAQQSVRAEKAAHFDRTLKNEFQSQVENVGIEPPKWTTVIEDGEIHTVIRDQISKLRPGLLALGTHGRAGLRHLLIGSVAANMLSDPPVDVIVVKD
jgi:nucleotide-binding universal stress UspA family protein